METKICKECKIEKPLNGFRSTITNDKIYYRGICKECNNLKNKLYVVTNKEKIAKRKKDYRENNKEKIVKYQKDYLEKNKEYFDKYHKEHREKNKEKRNEYSLNYNKGYYEKNKEILITKQLEYKKIKRQNDPLFKLKEAISQRIRYSFKQKKYIKKSRTFEILGCSFEEFKQYIESKFESWMNWDNYGLYNGELNYGWDIDHIIPVSAAMDEEGVINLNYYTNLQPLCSKVNRDIKRANY
jgi:hypothetical protein